jgi:hypothetical protein
LIFCVFISNKYRQIDGFIVSQRRCCRMLVQTNILRGQRNACKTFWDDLQKIYDNLMENHLLFLQDMVYSVISWLND